MEIITNKNGNLELISSANLVRETSYNAEEIGENEFTMELFTSDSGVPTGIEWDIPEIEETHGIGLWFEGRDLIDYDGVFELPLEAAKLIRKSGYRVSKDFYS